MLCVTTDCDQEARKGHYHCEGHEMKKAEQAPSEADDGRESRGASLVRRARRLVALGHFPSRTVIQHLLEETQDEWWVPATYDEVARALRQAVDSGDLISNEKNDTTFYSLPKAVPLDLQTEEGRKKLVEELTRDVAEDGQPPKEAAAPSLLDGSDRHPNWIACVNCKQRHPQSFMTDRNWCGNCNGAWQDGLAWAEAAKSPGNTQIIDHDAMRKLVNGSWDVRNLVDEMLRTGLYGRDYDDFVREAVCARVREYLKGKK